MADPQMVMVGGSWMPLMTSESQPAKECCCETPPEECCLYPWPDPTGAPQYPPEDLPDTVLLVNDGENEWNFLFTHVAGEYYYTTVSDPFIRLTATFVGDFGPSPFWRVAEYVGGEPTGIAFGVEMPCLIAAASYVSEDEFPDTLTAVLSGLWEATLTRVSLCVWTGTAIPSDEEYPTYPIRLQWSLTINHPFAPPEILNPIYGGWTIEVPDTSYNATKAGVFGNNESTPIGNYVGSGGPFVSGATVT